MKNSIILILSLTALHSANGQEYLPNYSQLRKKGDSLYRAKEYKNAAMVYTQVLTLTRPKEDFWDINRVAFSWSLAGVADSAFYYLNIIGTKKEITFSDYLDIVDDRDYKSLYNDNRWKVINDKIFANAGKSFHASWPIFNDKEKLKAQIAAVFAWTYNKNFDSAFYFMNKIVESASLTFQHVQNIITDGYSMPLRSDSRWTQATRKLFAQLREAYIPETAFDKVTGKRILVDEGHNNVHTTKTTFATLSGMLNAAGLSVNGYDGIFSKNSLGDADVLIIANPFCDRRDSLMARAQAAKQPFRWSDAASKSAYTKEEAVAIQQWVKNGGSLLLVLDHAPNPKAGGIIAEAFGVDIRNVATYAKEYRDPAADSTVLTTIIFTRSKSLIGKHPIMNGVDSLTTATGSSLTGPPQSEALLLLPATATDQDWLPETGQFRIRPATGRSQGVAFSYGTGRVIVLGEARMISPEATSVRNRGNWQMTLNILMWLLGSLE